MILPILEARAKTLIKTVCFLRDLKPRKNASEIILLLKLSSFCCNSEKNRWQKLVHIWQKTPKCWHLSNQLTRTTSILWVTKAQNQKINFENGSKITPKFGETIPCNSKFMSTLVHYLVGVLTFLCMLIFLKGKSTLKVRFFYCISA